VSSENEEPEDLGDEEVAAAEAAISHTAAPELGDKSEQELGAKTVGSPVQSAPPIPEITASEELPVTER
jgi:hypothetical protein